MTRDPQVRNWQAFKILVAIGAIDVTTLTAGVVVKNQWSSNYAYVSLSLAIVGIVTLLGLLYFLTAVSKLEATEAFRHSMAATFLIVYLGLIVMQSFPYSEEAGIPAPEITATLLTSFTTVAGVVFAFYFSSAAVERAFSRRQEAQAATTSTE